MKVTSIPGAKFAAIQTEGAALFVSGLGVTKGAAVKDAKALTDVSRGLTVLPISTRAKEAVELRGGTNNKAVTLAVVTVAELRILEALRRAN
jgi:hypothetical protein